MSTDKAIKESIDYFKSKATDGELAKVGPEGYVHGWIKVGGPEDVNPGDIVRFREAGKTSKTTAQVVRKISDRTIRGARMKMDKNAGYHVQTHVKDSIHVMPTGEGEIEKYNSAHESGL